MGGIWANEWDVGVRESQVREKVKSGEKERQEGLESEIRVDERVG